MDPSSFMTTSAVWDSLPAEAGSSRLPLLPSDGDSSCSCKATVPRLLLQHHVSSLAISAAMMICDRFITVFFFFSFV